MKYINTIINAIMARKPDKPEYTFDTKSRCPVAIGGCGSTHTKATRTRDGIQERVCLDCQKEYRVAGRKI